MDLEYIIRGKSIHKTLPITWFKFHEIFRISVSVAPRKLGSETESNRLSHGAFFWRGKYSFVGMWKSWKILLTFIHVQRKGKGTPVNLSQMFHFCLMSEVSRAPMMLSTTALRGFCKWYKMCLIKKPEYPRGREQIKHGANWKATDTKVKEYYFPSC